MKITQQRFDKVINATGSPALNHSTRPAICYGLARWFFIRQESESEATELVREYLIELDENGYVKWEGE